MANTRSSGWNSLLKWEYGQRRRKWANLGCLTSNWNCCGNFAYMWRAMIYQAKEVLLFSSWRTVAVFMLSDPFQLCYEAGYTLFQLEVRNNYFRRGANIHLDSSSMTLNHGELLCWIWVFFGKGGRNILCLKSEWECSMYVCSNDLEVNAAVLLPKK